MVWKKNQSVHGPGVVFHNGFGTIRFFIGFFTNRLRKVILDIYPTRYNSEGFSGKDETRNVHLRIINRCARRFIDDER